MRDGFFLVPRFASAWHNHRTIKSWGDVWLSAWDRKYEDNEGYYQLHVKLARRDLGCFRDSPQRDLPVFAFKSWSITPDLCVEKCRARGFAFAGTQAGSQCFCGNNYGKFGKAQNCDNSCLGGGGVDICGGWWANSVYRTRADGLALKQ